MVQAALLGELRRDVFVDAERLVAVRVDKPGLLSTYRSGKAALIPLPDSWSEK